MRNPYDPGHPIVFWLTIVLLLGGAYTGGRAVLTQQDCGDRGFDQEWKWVPPRWECKSPAIRL